MAILAMSPMGILAMSPMGILPMVFVFASSVSFFSQQQLQQRRHGQDARATFKHGQDAHATR
jgi:hypothetical protein